MKKTLITTLTLCALLFSASCSADKKEIVSAELKNPTGYHQTGYSIDISENWAKTNNANADLAFFYKNSDNDTFTENITTIIQDLSNYDYSLDTYKDLSVSQYEELGYKVRECEKITLDGTECYAITSSTTNDDTIIYCKQIFTLKNHKAYLFTFAAEEKNYNNLVAEVDAMFDTITFPDIETDMSSEAAMEAVSEEGNPEDGGSPENPEDTASANSPENQNPEGALEP